MGEFTISGLLNQFAELSEDDLLVGDDVSEAVDENKTKKLTVGLLLAFIAAYAVIAQTSQIGDGIITPPKTSFMNLPDGAEVYVGLVSSGGTGVELPDGWSVYNATSGGYPITHNLGHTNYIMIVTTVNNAGIYAFCNNKANNEIWVRTYNLSGSATNSDFNFILIDLGA